MIPHICPRDCPARCADPNCHSTCSQYAELRAVCDLAADKRRKDQLVRSYSIDAQGTRKYMLYEKRARLKSYMGGKQ